MDVGMKGFYRSQFMSQNDFLFTYSQIAQKSVLLAAIERLGVFG